MAEQTEVKERLWEQAKETLYLTREQFFATLEHFEIDPLHNDDGELFAVVLKRGPSFHFTTFGVKWSLTKAILDKYPGSIIREYGYAETFTPKSDTRQHRFNKRLGFVQVGEDEFNIHYRIERVRTCQPFQSSPPLPQ